MTNKITLDRISYANPKHRKILTSCMKSWFSNPQDLNFTDPRMRYPFDFRQWANLAYSGDDTVSYVLKQQNWIIGYFSLSLPIGQKTAILFHVYLDRGFRGKGLGKVLIDHVIQKTISNGYESLRLKVNPKNEKAIRLYESNGFIHIKILPGKILLMEKKHLTSKE